MYLENSTNTFNKYKYTFSEYEVYLWTDVRICENFLNDLIHMT